MTSIQRVLIVGAGWVGRQVAGKLAISGLDVGLIDRNQECIDDALLWLQSQTGQWPSGPNAFTQQSAFSQQSQDEEANLAWLCRVQSICPLPALSPERLQDWAPDLILECVSEQLSLKKRVLQKLSQISHETCIIASNSSYFVPSVLARFIQFPERFAHLHFHVPVLRDTVVDIVGCAQTQPHVLEALADLARRMGQHPLMLRNEHPGYVFNWLLQAVLKAALELVAADVVDPADVDRSWTSVTGMPLGPFGLMDQIGLDVIEQVLANARWSDHQSISDQRLIELIRPLIDQGKLGMKSGSGFYDWN